MKKKRRRKKITPDIWHLTPDTWHLTPDTGHRTPDTWHLTCDTWHMVRGEHSLKSSAPQLLRFGLDSVLKILNTKDDQLNQLMNEWMHEWQKCVYRTALATPGLLIIWKSFALRMNDFETSRISLDLYCFSIFSLSNEVSKKVNKLGVVVRLWKLSPLPYMIITDRMCCCKWHQGLAWSWSSKCMMHAYETTSLGLHMIHEALQDIEYIWGPNGNAT